MSAAPSRVLLVEDDPSLRELLAAALKGEGWLVKVAADAVAGERMAEAFKPDAAVLDIRLGAGPDGLALARRLRERSDLPFLFLTDQTAVADRLAGFDSGADDYLAKPFVLAELVARLQVLLRRRRSGHDVVALGQLEIDESGRQVFAHGSLVELTRIEFDLLNALAADPGRVASKAQLLVRVWGFEGYDQNLVEVHISSMRRKLGALASMVQTVRGVGYVLRAS